LTEESSTELKPYIDFWGNLVDDIEINFLGSWLGQIETEHKHVKEKHPCMVLGRQVVVLVDGNVTTCCVDYRGENVFGNIREQPIDKIMQSGNLQEYIRANQLGESNSNFVIEQS
jgi:Arylsulfatase regulator (Fe-S oxidoreductase)